MADPSPSALKSGGLPESEYIELRNNSLSTIDLMGWKISDAVSNATINIHFLLKPDSVVTICSTTSAITFSRFGPVVGIPNFPSLDNDSDMIILTTSNGLVIFALEYSATWFNNSVKQVGGWSLEMGDVHSPCTGAGNWVACESPVGGTPGQKNSVSIVLKDSSPPDVVRSFATDSLHVMILFNEVLNEKSAMSSGNYLFEDPGLLVGSIAMGGPLYNSVRINLAKPVKRNSVYWLTVNNISDCAGNLITAAIRLKTGLAAGIDSGGIVINEILFNPVSPGVDYTEIYNQGQNIIDLQHLLIANRSAAGVAGPGRQISTQPRLIFPEDYCVITEDPVEVQKQFIAKEPVLFSQVPSMPSFPDDKGTVLILNSRGKLFDELAYDEKWHFALISEREGIALERIDPAKPTADKNNWHSASGSAGYGTPTFRNSQGTPIANADDGINVLPKVFSPDNDGRDDYAIINYRFPDPGYVCNINVYDALGNLVRNVARSLLCGREGYLRWDGLNNADRKVPTGTYVMVCEVFALNGVTRKSKHVLIVASGF